MKKIFIITQLAQLVVVVLTRQDCATLQHIVDVLHHDALHILQLCVDVADVAPAVGQLLFRLLYVHIELYEGVGACHRIDTPPIVRVKLLRQILQVIESQPLRIHFINHHQVADIVLD